MRSSTGYRLTQDELDAFDRDGLTIPDTELPAALHAKAKTAVDVLIPRLPESSPEFALVAHLPARPGVTDGIEGGEAVFEIATDRVVVDLVEQVLGPDVVLWGSSIFVKPAGHGKRVQWHQDSYWWPMRPLKTCTMWMAIDDATTENGCLRYIPGSHHWSVLEHRDEAIEGLLGMNARSDLIDDRAARDVVLRRGQFSLHQANLVHGSDENTSPYRRTALVLRYMPADCHFDRGNAVRPEDTLMRTGSQAYYRERPIWLVRGQNRHPANDFVVGHEGLEDLDALAEAAR